MLTTITVVTDALKLSAEVLTDQALERQSPQLATAALELLDALKVKGIGCAAELCREDLEHVKTYGMGE